MRHTIFAFVLPVTLAMLGLTGCGRPFDVKTAPGFVELQHQDPPYAYRATTPEGVVLAVRVADVDGRGDLAFWTKAVTLKLREQGGYALLATRDVRSKDGTPGKELELGHDENGKPFLYIVRIFVAQGRVFLVETGGAKPEVERYRPSLEWMLASVQVKCDTFVSPVLASRTCNRW